MDQCIKFYNVLAKYYDDIFPAPEWKKKFALKNIDKGGFVLDIGCSTGETTEYISSQGYRALGIDLDQEMIKIAKNRYNESDTLRFKVMDMKAIAQSFGEEFNGIVCIGNVLPHLGGKNQIKEFLKGCYEVLKKDSPLCIQTINFDKVKREHIKELPLIDGPKVKFERFYSIKPDSDIVKFTGRITDKKSNEILENTVDLFMLENEELFEMLRELGFEKIQSYDDFKRSNYTGNALPLIVEAIK
ncbi:methyltransferase domain-containing protein [Clostridium sp.]|uniref:class I SAM-dependent methyltransferase n=1 Tax=Clostridium sp. TaxID=1506 RepID=UPI003217F9FE